MRGKEFRKFIPGSAWYVLTHAIWAKRRGRGPSMPYKDVHNPREALSLATLDACPIDFEHKPKFKPGDVVYSYGAAENGNLVQVKIVRIPPVEDRSSPIIYEVDDPRGADYGGVQEQAHLLTRKEVKKSYPHLIAS